MKLIFFVILFTAANIASAQIPKDIHDREHVRDKSSRDIKYEKAGKSDKFQEIPFRKGAEIPEYTNARMSEIIFQIRKCNYDRQRILSRLELLESNCTDLKTRNACIITARKKYLQTLIDNCNK